MQRNLQPFIELSPATVDLCDSKFNRYIQTLRHRLQAIIMEKLGLADLGV